VQSGLIELQTKADNAKSTAEIQSIRTLINSFTQVRAGVLHIRHTHACAQQRFLAAPNSAFSQRMVMDVSPMITSHP
jgi:hypothetical protein